MHFLKVGPHYLSLEECLYHDIRSLKTECPDALCIVVPSNGLAQHLTRVLLRRGMVLFNIRVMTFIDLVQAIVDGLDPLAAQKVVSPLERQLLVKEVLDTRRGRHYFSDIQDRKGFLRRLSVIFDDLDENGFYDPSQWTHVRSVKAKTLFQLYQDYRVVLSAHRLSPGDLFRRAKEHVSAWVASSRPMIFYGFYDLQGMQRQLMEALAAQTSLWVYMPQDVSDDGYMKETRQWLDRVGVVNIPMEVDARQAPIACVVSAVSPVSEMRWIAKKMVFLHEHERIPWQEMCVCVRNVSLYESLVRDVFCEFQIPYVGTIRGDQSKEASVLRRFLMLYRCDFDREMIFDFLLSDLFDDTRVDLYAMHDLMRTRSVHRHQAVWMRELHDLQQSDEVHQDIEDFILLIQDIFSRIETLHRLNRWADCALLLEEILTRFCFKTEHYLAIVHHLHKMAALDDLAVAFDPSQMLDVVMCHIAQLSLREVSEVFEESVSFCGVMAARGRHWAAVFVPGLTEGAFPQAPLHDPIFLEEDRLWVNQSTTSEICVATQQRRMDEERLLFQLVCRSARAQLFLSYPRYEAYTLEENVPSIFLLEFYEQQTGHIHMDASHLGNGLVWEHSHEDIPIVRDAIGSVREYDLYVMDQWCRHGSAEALSLGKRYPAVLSVCHMEQSLWGDDQFGAYDGCLQEPEDQSWMRSYAREHVFSVSELEQFAACPYQYFLQHVLGVTAVDEEEEAWVMAGDRYGQFVHRCLSDVYARLSQDGACSLDEILDDSMGRLAKGPFRAFLGQEPMATWTLQTLKREMHQLICFDRGSLGGRVPQYFETAFGPERAFLFFDDTKKDAIKMKGRIDRIDIDRDTGVMTVVDYKTTRQSDFIKWRDNDLAKGTRLQVPLYMMAAEQIVESGPSKVEGRYVSTRQRHLFHQVCYGGAQLQDELVVFVQALVCAMTRGVFLRAKGYAGPQNPACQHCDYRTVCSKPYQDVFALKKQDEGFFKQYEDKGN